MCLDCRRLRDNSCVGFINRGIDIDCNSFVYCCDIVISEELAI
jgi:hypothetical protein